MNIGCMMLIFKIIKIILLKVIYLNIIIFIKITNLYLMFKLNLNKKHVAYAWKMKNKNLLKVFVDIMYVQNVLKNQLKIKDKIIVLIVK